MMESSKKTITLDYAARNANPAAFSTMVKPAGSLCNLDCHYCYYLDKSLQYDGKQPLMSPELLERFTRQYIEANEVPVVTFLWHGGEPLMQGVDFYRKALELQNRYSSGKKIENVLQTNGTLLNEEWCKFFAKNNFLIGISIDGPKDIHDTFRLNKAGKPSFEKVMNGINLLKKYKVEFNTLSVVNKLSEKRGREVYQFLRNIGSHYMQFLPAVEHVVEIPGRKRAVIVPPDHEGAHIAPWSVSANGYGEFLNEIFDIWVRNDVGQYFVQIFDSTLAQYCGIQPGLCSMNETCGEALIVEHNGDVYPCDHFVYPEYKLGNISEKSLREIYLGQKRFDFGMD
ncbi:MAG: anaerobic sulfatase maturase, partial [Bacteroidales bacterium]|nr:anaerobic sulfatase maturase [Bacteroidales bacterium]